MIYAVVAVAMAWLATLVAAYLLGRKKTSSTPAFDQRLLDAEKKKLSDLWEETSVQARAIAHRRSDIAAAEVKHEQESAAALSAIEAKGEVDVDAALRAAGALKPE